MRFCQNKKNLPLIFKISDNFHFHHFLIWWLLLPCDFLHSSKKCVRCPPPRNKKVHLPPPPWIYIYSPPWFFPNRSLVNLPLKMCKKRFICQRRQSLLRLYIKIYFAQMCDFYFLRHVWSLLNFSSNAYAAYICTRKTRAEQNKRGWVQEKKGGAKIKVGARTPRTSHSPQCTPLARLYWNFLIITSILLIRSVNTPLPCK